jgi:hypothetical protein
VVGLTSSFFLTSACFPSRNRTPAIAYWTTFGFVVIEILKPTDSLSFVLLCSSSLALRSKKRLSEGNPCPVLSAWRLSILMETMTPETEYFGLMGDTSW